MNKTRTLCSALLALMLAVCMIVPAMAEGETGSITINDAIVGQTYTIYQILDLESYNASANAYAYKANNAWETFINSSAIKGTYVEVDAQGYVTWKGNTTSDPVAFAKAAQKYAKDNSIANQGSVTATTTTVSFTGLDLGYYLVDSTLGTLCSLDTTNPSVTMHEKNQAPTNIKAVEEDSKTGDEAWGSSNDADIGQTVNFKSTITAQAGAENYVFHDTMSAGLTFTGVTGITLNNVAVTAENNYSVVTENLSDGCTFEVHFTQAFCDKLTANDQIVISYTATLNEKAVIAGDGNPNTSKVSYGDSSNTKYTPDSQTKTYTWDVDVFKYTMIDNAESALAGATFTLSKNANGSTPIALINLGENMYRVAKTGETGTVTEITTDTTGKFTIKGLDADTYYLTETQAPAGYNKLAGPITIVINDEGKTLVDTKVVDEVKVLNQSGTELPSTGGIGTTVFYVVGGLLVVGAFILLVSKRRVGAEK
ncbi:MAG: SpaH/EbpB family LPXTG-anchored major pilin [Eubacteriales bacterium]|nr:SpaH/EbpB family LPXTG-anchored major pilin [Eubacteriales bacterium]